MSAIWKEAEGPRHVCARRLQIVRIVEGQHKVSTRKLVDTIEEQDLLESLLDGHGPQRKSRAVTHLHHLLSTPFRTPPLRHGSRFGSRVEQSIWYGSLDIDTALSERAYYRLLFLAGSAAKLAPVICDETAFTAELDTQRFVDLSAPPFAACEAAIAAPNSYAHSQPLGTAMRDAGVHAFLFVSARARPRGLNAGLFEPDFATAEPLHYESWKCTVTQTGAEFRSLAGRALVFARSQFEVDGRLPAPGLS